MRADARVPNAAGNGEASNEETGAECGIPPGAAMRIAPMLPAGADPEAVRDWFALETIVSLPPLAASFAAGNVKLADFEAEFRNNIALEPES